MINVVEEWTVVDKWWTKNPDEQNFREIVWNDRTIVFKQQPPDLTWRIYIINLEKEKG